MGSSPFIKLINSMDKLKARILQDGKCYPGGILKVDSFINHQMDPNLMMEVAKEFATLFADLHINKIVTIEASGIAPAILVGYIMQLPVVFIKKKEPKTMENMLTSVVHSFTKDRDYTFLHSTEPFRKVVRRCANKVFAMRHWLRLKVWTTVRLS